MRKTRKIVNLAVIVSMTAGLLATSPVMRVQANEVDAGAAVEAESVTEQGNIETATMTDADVLRYEEAQAGDAVKEEKQTISDDETIKDADGFVWWKDKPTILCGYEGNSTNVKIPDKCTGIGYDAFLGREEIKSIEIPSSVTTIDAYAFSECTGLTGIEIPSSVTYIGEYAFSVCTGLTSIKIPSSVTEIRQAAFYKCSNLKNINIPNGVTSIADYTFSECSSLTGIEIPSGITWIGYGAFAFCDGIKNIRIPAGVSDISAYAFYNCDIDKIEVDSENPVYTSGQDSNAIITRETKELVLGCKNTKIPSDVTTIGVAAFSGSGVTSIKIPFGVTEIMDSAFIECDKLKSIEIPSGVTYIGESSFNGCSSLTDITLPDSVTEIGPTAFKGCRNLMSATIPENVTEIPGGVFSECSSLTSITIPAGVTRIGWRVFEECSSLTGITIPASVTEIGWRVFDKCSSLASIEVDDKNPVYDSRENCNAIIETETNILIAGCQNTKIPAGVAKIGNSAFSGCSNLTSLEIPSSVKTIGQYAFDGCTSLTSITLPDNVEEIGTDAFLYSGLKTIRGYYGSYAETYAKQKRYKFVDLNAPVVPAVKNLNAVPAGKNKVKLTWDKVNGAIGYIVYARKNDTYAKVGVTAATSYTDTKALDNDHNFYFVYAYEKDSAGNVVVGKCEKYAYAKGACMAVTNLKAFSVKGGVKLTWTRSVGADGYIVYGKKTDFAYGYVGMTTPNTSTSYTDTKADKKNYNFYWVFPFHYDKNGKRVIGPICGYVYGKAK